MFTRSTPALDRVLLLKQKERKKKEKSDVLVCLWICCCLLPALFSSPRNESAAEPPSARLLFFFFFFGFYLFGFNGGKGQLLFKSGAISKLACVDECSSAVHLVTPCYCRCDGRRHLYGSGCPPTSRSHPLSLSLAVKI